MQEDIYKAALDRIERLRQTFGRGYLSRRATPYSSANSGASRSRRCSYVGNANSPPTGIVLSHDYNRCRARADVPTDLITGFSRTGSRNDGATLVLTSCK